MKLRSAAIIALLAAAQAASAQQPTRWQPWLGCWTAGSKAMAPDLGGTIPRIICATPTDDPQIIEIKAIDNGQIVSTERIDASGRPQPIVARGCNGSQTAKWSNDGKRVFVKSSVVCEGTPIETSAIIALTPYDDWLDIRAVSAGAGSSPAVHVARYRDVGFPSGVPSEITSVLAEQDKSNHAARRVSGAAVGPDAIVEATKTMGGELVEAWVIESEQRFAVNEPALMELADAGVPSNVTDAMIDVSAENQMHTRSRFYRLGGNYPRNGEGSSNWWDQSTGERLVFPRFADLDPWGFGWGTGAPIVSLWPANRIINNSLLGNTFLGIGGLYGFGMNIGLGMSFGAGLMPSYYNNAAGHNPRARIAMYRPAVLNLRNDTPGTEPRGRASASKTESNEKDQPSIARQIVDKAISAATGGGKSSPTPPAVPKP